MGTKRANNFNLHFRDQLIKRLREDESTRKQLGLSNEVINAGNGTDAAGGANTYLITIAPSPQNQVGQSATLVITQDSVKAITSQNVQSDNCDELNGQDGLGLNVLRVIEEQAPYVDCKGNIIQITN